MNIIQYCICCEAMTFPKANTGRLPFVAKMTQSTSMLDKRLSELVDENITCDICAEDRHGQFVQMPCNQHSFCYRCVHTMVEWKERPRNSNPRLTGPVLKIACPKCKSPECSRLTPELDGLSFRNNDHNRLLSDLQQLIAPPKPGRYNCPFNGCIKSFSFLSEIQRHLRECGSGRFICKRKNFDKAECGKLCNPNSGTHHEQECESFWCEDCVLYGGKTVNVTGQDNSDHEAATMKHRALVEQMKNKLELLTISTHTVGTSQTSYENLLLLNAAISELTDRICCTTPDSSRQSLMDVYEKSFIGFEDRRKLCIKTGESALHIANQLARSYSSFANGSHKTKLSAIHDIFKVLFSKCELERDWFVVLHALSDALVKLHQLHNEAVISPINVLSRHDLVARSLAKMTSMLISWEETPPPATMDCSVQSLAQLQTSFEAQMPVTPIMLQQPLASRVLFSTLHSSNDSP